MDRIILAGCSDEDRKVLRRAIETAQLMTFGRIVVLVENVEPFLFRSHLSDEALKLDIPIIDVARNQRDRRTIKEHRAAMRKKL